MFEGLKKKFSDFVGSIVKKEEKKAEEQEEIIETKAEEKEEPKKEVQEKKTETNKEQPKVTTSTKIKSIFLSKVTIKEGDVSDLLESFKNSLLEADVNYDVAERLTNDIKGKLVGASVESKNIGKGINSIISSALLDLLNKGEGVDILKLIEAKRQSKELPFKVLFLGPNGAGKTTTMAKVANMLIEKKITCIFAASDTFRAAAIEQTVHHAGKLGISVIKSSYGADPASVAFDAIAFAKARGIDVVLIDSAGRQETNKSLLEEIKKMDRVAKPDLKIFIGEGIAGNALLEQVREFDKAVKLSGIILTKLDADAKGGNTISILSDTDVPVLFFGVGEKYTDLMPYNPQFVVDNIMPN